MAFLFLLLIGIIVIISLKSDKKTSYTSPVSHTAYTSRAYHDIDDDDDELMFDDDEDDEDDYYDDDDDIHDTGEIFNRFQDGNMSKSDIEHLMEDDDIRDEFYEDY